MGSQTFNAIYIGTIGQSNIFDIDFDRPSFQTNQPNDPDWSANGGIDSDDTTTEGAGLFLNNAYSPLEAREITLTGTSADDYYMANATTTDTLTDGGRTATFEGTAYYGGTLVFNDGSGGTISVPDVHLRIIQDADGRTYFTDTHGGREGWTDFGDTLEIYGLENLVSITPQEYSFGGDYRTSPNSDDGAYYDSRGSIAGVNIEGDGTNDGSTIQSLVVPCFTSGTMIATSHGPVAVENLQSDDRVLDHNGNAQPILWHGRNTVMAKGQNCAVVLPAGVLGLNHKTIVSQQHCMVLNAGGKNFFIKAKFLAEVNWEGCYFAADKAAVTYHHLLLPKHTVIIANGALSESFYPGAHILSELPVPVKDSLFAVLPALAACKLPADVTRCYGRPALPRMTRTRFMRRFNRIVAKAA